MKKMKIIIFLSLALISTVFASETIESDVCRIDDDSCKEEKKYHRAAQMKSAEVTKILFENGAEKEAKNNSGETALHKKAYYDSAEVARVLIENGADKEQKYRENLELIHLVGENHNSMGNRAALQQLAKDEKIILLEETPFRIAYHAPKKEKWEVTRFMLEDKYFDVMHQCIGVICSHPAHSYRNMFELKPHESDDDWHSVKIEGFKKGLPNRRESVVPAAFSLLKEHYGEEFMHEEFGDYYPYEGNYEETKFPDKNMIPLAKKLGGHFLKLLRVLKKDTQWMKALEANCDPENTAMAWLKSTYDYFCKGGEITISWMERLFENPSNEPGFLAQGCNMATFFYAGLHDKVQTAVGFTGGNAGLSFKGMRNMIFVENTIEVLKNLKSPYSKLPVFLVIGNAHLPDTADKFGKLGIKNIKRWGLEVVDPKKIVKKDFTQQLEDQEEFNEFLEKLKN